MAGKEEKMKEIKKRTLYECGHARVMGDTITCQEGYPLNSMPGSGLVRVSQLAKGKRLAFKVCQGCPGFDCMGSPVPPEERGWLRKEVN
jgi:hypothetical protein